MSCSSIGVFTSTCNSRSETPDHWKHSVEYGPHNTYPGRMKEMIDRSSPGGVAIEEPSLSQMQKNFNMTSEEINMKAGKKMYQFTSKQKTEPTIKLNKKPMKIEKLQKGNQLQDDIKIVKGMIKTTELEKGCVNFPTCASPSKDVYDELCKIVESNQSALLKKLNAKLTELETEFEKL